MGGMKVLLILCLVFGIFAEQSEASFIKFLKCYKKCYVPCVVTSSPALCGFECVKECKSYEYDASSLNKKSISHFFCSLGCSSHMCTNLSSKDNPNEEKVESCVGACSTSCDKNYN
ncbi:hypothetical protein M5689_021613 [Euphorbia peplus]|nr:hypothetical protein M5689_021613 [Euphorbia peplus]